MKFESVIGITVQSVPRETLYEIHKGESYWTLTRDEAMALICSLQRALDYEATE